MQQIYIAMPYSQFTLDKVKKEFDLSTSEKPEIFAAVEFSIQPIFWH